MIGSEENQKRIEKDILSRVELKTLPYHEYHYSNNTFQTGKIKMNNLSTLIKPIIDERCSKIVIHNFNELKIDFSEISKYTHPNNSSFIVKGKWQLNTQTSFWTARYKKHIIATNSFLDDEIEIEQLQNKKVTNVFLGENLTLGLIFEKDYLFTLEVDLDYSWELFMPTDQVLVVSGNKDWELNSIEDYLE